MNLPMCFKVTALVYALFLMAGQIQAATPISGVTDFGSGDETLATGAASGSGLVAQNVFGWNFNLVTKSADTLGLYVGDLAWESGSGLQYYSDTVSVVSLDFLSGSSNGGEYFDLVGLNVSLTGMDFETSSITLEVKGFRNGLEVGNYSKNIVVNQGASQFDWLDINSSAGFMGIDEFRISPAAGSEIGYLGIDNLTAVNFVPEPSGLLLGGLFGTLSLTRRRR